MLRNSGLHQRFWCWHFLLRIYTHLLCIEKSFSGNSRSWYFATIRSDNHRSSALLHKTFTITSKDTQYWCCYFQTYNNFYRLLTNQVTDIMCYHWWRLPIGIEHTNWWDKVLFGITIINDNSLTSFPLDVCA